MKEVDDYLKDGEMPDNFEDYPLKELIFPLIFAYDIYKNQKEWDSRENHPLL